MGRWGGGGGGWGSRGDDGNSGNDFSGGVYDNDDNNNDNNVWSEQRLRAAYKLQAQRERAALIVRRRAEKGNILSRRNARYALSKRAKEGSRAGRWQNELRAAHGEDLVDLFEFSEDFMQDQVYADNPSSAQMVNTKNVFNAKMTRARNQMKAPRLAANKDWQNKYKDAHQLKEHRLSNLATKIGRSKGKGLLPQGNTIKNKLGE